MILKELLNEEPESDVNDGKKANFLLDLNPILVSY